MKTVASVQGEYRPVDLPTPLIATPQGVAMSTDTASIRKLLEDAGLAGAIDNAPKSYQKENIRIITSPFELTPKWRKRLGRDYAFGVAIEFSEFERTDDNGYVLIYCPLTFRRTTTEALVALTERFLLDSRCDPDVVARQSANIRRVLDTALKSFIPQN